MNASKENARLAQRKLDELMRIQTTEGSEPLADFIMEFLRRAEAKLPRESSFVAVTMRKRMPEREGS